MTKALRLTISCLATTVVLSVTTMFSPGSLSPVSAAPGDGIAAYISPPFVQGPPSNINAAIEDFDSANFCTAPGLSGAGVVRSVGTFTGSCSQLTSADNNHKFGGANTTTDQPTIGGTASPFIQPSNSPGLTLTFLDNNPARYIGFWWSAGSEGNRVEFYSKVNGNDVKVAEFTTTTLNQLLNTSGATEASVLPPNPYPGTQTVTALDGSPYNKGYYFGRPRDHSSLTPTAIPVTYSVHNNIYSHAYLNVYASGGISFSKVVFSGGGFEMDNVAISNLTHTPSSELALLQSVLGKFVEFRANGGTGSMAAQTSDSQTTLTPNAFTRDGHTFAGWSTSPTGTVEYIDSDSYAFTADTTLYAIWTLNTYTVTYEEHGGSSVPDGSFTHNGSLTFPTAPTRSGYTFDGWFMAASGGSSVSASTVASGNANVTLHAQWTSNEQPPAESSPTSQSNTDASTPSPTSGVPQATTPVVSNNALPKTGQQSAVALLVGMTLLICGATVLRRSRKIHINP